MSTDLITYMKLMNIFKDTTVPLFQWYHIVLFLSVFSLICVLDPLLYAPFTNVNFSKVWLSTSHLGGYFYRFFQWVTFLEFPSFPYLFAMKWWDRMPWSLFFECWVLNTFYMKSIIKPQIKFLMLVLWPVYGLFWYMLHEHHWVFSCWFSI